MSTRQTLRDYLTSVGSTRDAISMPVNPGTDDVVAEGDDLGIEPQTGRPLLDFSTNESLLGDYASFITQQNMFPLAPGVHLAPGTDRGDALSNAETQSAVNVFAPDSGPTNPYALDRSNSGQFDASGNPLNTLIDKTGAGSAPTGNDLYGSIVAASADSDVAPDQSRAVQATFSVLRKYNNISPAAGQGSYVAEYETATQFDSNSVTRIQTGMGEYEEQTVTLSAEVTQAELAVVARSMILRATGWDTSQIPVDAINPDQFMENLSVDDLAKFPSVARSIPSGPDAFRARDSYGMPQGAGGESKLAGAGDVVQRTAEDSNYSNSAGASYTPERPFIPNPNDPVNVRIQALQAGIAIVGLGVLIEKVLNNNKAYFKELQVTKDQVLRGPYYMGSSLKSRVTTKVRALVKSFMFQTGIYSYAACVSEGLYATFGFTTLNAVDLPIEIDTPFLARRYKEEITNIANNAGKGAFYEAPLGMSHGFWRSVSENAVKIITRIQRSTASADALDFANCVLTLPDSLAIRVLNVFAQIGYQRLVIQTIPTADLTQSQPKNPWGLDDYVNAPGTRQMKSRDGELLSKTSLAWRNSSLPSMFLLPVEAMTATLDLDFMFDKDKGSNPIKGMLGSTLYDKVYVNGAKNENLIPAGVAKRLEDRLGAEYLPFYFRDMRTNEIIAFHGFLESITDQYSPTHVTTQGFGRSDGVKNYSNTKRSIGGNFWIVATSKEDFDEMWFKINKLTTLAYPQYTRGRDVSAPDPASFFGGSKTYTFEQPFSQLVGGTPLVRMRIGDLIKTNYSRYNLGRIFGVGNERFGVETKDLEKFDFIRGNALQNVPGLGAINKVTDLRLIPFLAYAASPMELTRLTGLASGQSTAAQGVINAAADATAELASYFLKNGFVNPLLYIDRTRVFRSGRDAQLGYSANDTAVGDAVNQVLIGAGNVLLKARPTPYIVGGKTNLRIHRPIMVKIDKQITNDSGIAYEVIIKDNTAGPTLQDARLIAAASDLYVDTASIVDVTSFPGVLLSLGLISTAAGVAANAASAAANLRPAGSDIGPVDLPLADIIGSFGRTFTSPVYNPITRAFEDRMGEGLAGVFTNLTFNWMEAPWETDWNSRAPMACKVQFSFDPIHDISPGLDANGFNRAPLYNVGQIMHDSFGGSRQDGGNASRYFYKRGGSVAENAKNPEKATGA